MEVQIPYKPRKWADVLHSSLKRWFSLIIHRRGGKTTGILNHLQRYATDDEWEAKRIKHLMPEITNEELKTHLKKRQYFYIGPTYTQTKRMAWLIAKEISHAFPGVKYNEQELYIQYPNGSRLTLLGSENTHSLRGIAAWGVGFDEYSQQPPGIFSEIISKALADHLGFAIFGGTVIGKNQLYRTHETAKNYPDDWDFVWQDIDESIKKEEGITIKMLERALEEDRRLVEQGEMSQEEFEQEWYLSVEAAIKGAYYSKNLKKAREDERITSVPYDELLPVHTWWDIGVGDSTAIIFFQHYGKEWRIIDYYEKSGEGLAHYAKVLKDKDYFYGTHTAPHDIEVREFGTGKTRKEIGEELKLNFEVAPKLSIEDGINAVRMRFNTLWIDKVKGEKLIELLSLYHKEWDEKKGQFKPKPNHDFTSHAADALRYWAVTPEKDKETTTQFIPEWVNNR